MAALEKLFLSGRMFSRPPEPVERTGVQRWAEFGCHVDLGSTILFTE
ncbi:hypothetical protein GQ607_009914 [Colletotrichum asianum]|uniref:Uncharacterized protein n=1 Tax=Colletotrichum asianum TaxID=702518 RepID=A0A8H3ZKQ9_9PEZI|nr:hypothetical protein GQ607_009914 [Colletotrichum asianum]